MIGLIVAAGLMYFLFYSYGMLTRVFSKMPGVNVDTTKELEKFSLRRLLLVVLMFVGCYFFISMTINITRMEIFSELLEKHSSILMQAFQQNARPKNSVVAEDDAAPNPEQSKAGNERMRNIKLLPANQVKTKFTDVAGVKEAKEEVQDLIAFLNNPAEFTRLGAKSPKGVLLYGEPGTGKTLLARAIAGEADVAFIAVSGAEFDEEYVGIGALRVRQLFELARQNAPCIIFIDEIDALAHKRNPHDPAWSAQTVNQLLTEMDGLDANKNQGIVVIGASNRIDAMDPAILRPGRLDRHVKLDLPSLVEREEILALYFKTVKIDKNVSPKKIAKISSGFSGAQLANLVNEAAIHATKEKKKLIDVSDFDVAKDRIVLGSKHMAADISDKTRRVTAYHEAGHALIGYLLNPSQPLYKVTITPRGPSLGHTSFETKTDQYSLSKKEIEAMLATNLGGRVAEELVFGEENITTGAESDLHNASELAYNMVTRWGYSKRVGLLHQNNRETVISKDVIAEEVRAIMNNSYALTKQILTENRAKLDALAQALLEHETLDAQQVRAILEAKVR